MKKVVVSLLVVMMALAFSMTGVVAAQTCPATTASSCATTTACPATTSAQCTSAATSACCTPCPVVCCPVVKCPTTTCPTPCPAVVCCAVTTCCQFQTVVATTPVTPAVKAAAEKVVESQVSKGSKQSPQTVVDNKVKQSNTGTQTSTINIDNRDGDWTGDVYVDQYQDQTNVVKTKVDNTNNNIDIGDVHIDAASKGGEINENSNNGNTEILSDNVNVIVPPLGPGVA